MLEAPISLNPTIFYPWCAVQTMVKTYPLEILTYFAKDPIEISAIQLVRDADKIETI